MDKIYYIYILTSDKYGTLYIGRTNELISRIEQHKLNEGSAFTKKYKVNKLVYFEQFSDFESSLMRERQIKKWKRDWKIRLIEEKNPNWEDLSCSLT